MADETLRSARAVAALACGLAYARPEDGFAVAELRRSTRDVAVLRRARRVVARRSGWDRHVREHADRLLTAAIAVRQLPPSTPTSGNDAETATPTTPRTPRKTRATATPSVASAALRAPVTRRTRPIAELDTAM